tara:strand:- start:2035 stop:2331 length:297 start_codon:yes stop_codon:yes gene_type:complete
MINYKRFDIEHDEEKIILDVELAVRHKGEKVTICDTSDILNELKKRDVKVGECVERPDIVSDRKANRIRGRWIFNLPTQQKRVTPQKAPRKSAKTNKK